MRHQIRKMAEADIEALMALYPKAFPEEELRDLVRALIDLPEQTRSWCAFDGDLLVGHALYSLGAVGGETGAALLGPLAVMPSHQRQGIGRGLQEQAHRALETEDVRQVFLLGDPSYYARVGFAQEREVKTPCPIPDDWAGAWQSQTLGRAARFGAGVLSLPEPWMDPAYWAP